MQTYEELSSSKVYLSVVFEFCFVFLNVFLWDIKHKINIFLRKKES